MKIQVVMVAMLVAMIEVMLQVVCDSGCRRCRRPFSSYFNQGLRFRTELCTTIFFSIFFFGAAPARKNAAAQYCLSTINEEKPSLLVMVEL